MYPTHFMTLTLIALTGLLLLPTSNAFTFNFTSPPAQCTNTIAQWSGGQAPFRLLLIPTGRLNPEVRVIVDFAIANGTSFTFPLTYPENSTFVAVMSDATGFGAGGTTDIITVAATKDTSCLVKTQVAPAFYMFTSPSVPQECTPMNISYSADAKPPVDIFAVVPSGASSRIEAGAPTNRSFVWVPALPAGASVMLVAGDVTGTGKGGSTDVLTIAAAANSTTCSPPVTTSPAASPTTQPSSAASQWTISLWPILLCAFLTIFA
ncbi:hypothetical protein BU17DRAFT_89882 [Hysterangium stoloniferum]|nr:hypothetical protein BU17DRAFT_89882 [Hysterangium stoloniferum]